MKIFILKKRVVLVFFITLIVILSFFLRFGYSSAISLSQGEILDDNFTNKFNSICNNPEKVAYLTFDDGPTSKVTPKILDILEQENVKATFFVVGKHVKEYPEIVKRAYDEGHFIANHGYSHSNRLLYKSETDFCNEILNTDIEIANAIGEPNYCSHVFRFPNGYSSPSYKKQKKIFVKKLTELNYVYIDWNCLNKDSEKKYSNYNLLKNLKKTAKDKGSLVILMHDTGDVNNTYDVLKDSINYLKSQGYVFKNFYELFKK